MKYKPWRWETCKKVRQSKVQIRLHVHAVWSIIAGAQWTANGPKLLFGDNTDRTARIRSFLLWPGLVIILSWRWRAIDRIRWQKKKLSIKCRVIYWWNGMWKYKTLSDNTLGMYLVWTIKNMKQIPNFSLSEYFFDLASCRTKGCEFCSTINPSRLILFCQIENFS